MRRTPAVLLAALLAGPVAGQDLAGPPAPDHEPPRPRRVATEAERDDARGAWRWYAVGWGVDAASTGLALGLNPHAREAHPLGRPAPVLAIKAVLAVGAWRLGMHWTEAGAPGRARVLRWLFLGLSLAAGAWNLSGAF